MKKIFNYLDDDKDKHLNYIEFSNLNKSSNITSRLPGYKYGINNKDLANSRLNSRAKSKDAGIAQIIHDDIDKLSISSFYYRGYKYGGSRPGRQESRLSNYSWISGHKHGIPSPVNDHIGEIINHSYVYDNQKNESYQIKNIKKIKALPNVPTKASKLRADYLFNQKIESENLKNNESKPEWKLRQFLGIGPSEDISEITVQKHHSTIDNESLPHIKDNTNDNKAQFEKIDKKEKDRLLSDYYSQKRELNSRK